MTISTEEIRKTITERGLDCVSDVEGLELLARLERAEKERDALRAELDALKSREGEVVYRWLALDYSGFCYGSNPPDNLPNRCNLKAFYAPAEVAP